MTDEVRARFLAAIAAQLPGERVKEVHLFSAIKQGGTESGIAVVAVELDAPVAPDDVVAEADLEEEVVGEEIRDEEILDEPELEPPPALPPARYTVFTARYRLTLKGPERGKWEMSVKEEADAPLLTVEAVVRGVSRRSGDADETVRLSGDEFRAALPEPARA